MMIGTVERIGPERARLYVKGLAPRVVLVPVGELPFEMEKGERVQLVIQRLSGTAAEVQDEEPAEKPTRSGSVANYNGMPIRVM